MAICTGIQFMFALLCSVQVQAANDTIFNFEKKLYHDLVKEYNKNVRPVKNPKETLEVKFGMSLQQILNVDEGSDEITLAEWHNFEWTDFQLVWDVGQYGGIKSIRIQPEDLWVPDVDPYNGGHTRYDDPKHAAIVVYSSGICSFVPKITMTYSCAFDLSNFPFDDQYCKMKYGSWTYDGSKINLTARADNIDLSTYQKSKEWKLFDVPAVRNIHKYECCVEEYIDVTFNVHIRRRTTHYLHAMVAPSLAMALLLPTLFVLPPDSNGKMTLGIGILICNAVLMAMLQMNVPKSGFGIPVIGKYFLANMILSAFSIGMAANVMNVWKKGDRGMAVPSVLRTVVLGVFGRLCCVRRDSYLAVEEGTSDKETSTNVVKATNTAEWRQLATILDRLFLVIFLVLSVLLCVSLVRS